MLYTAFALLTGQTHKFDLQTVQNNVTVKAGSGWTDMGQ